LENLLRIKEFWSREKLMKFPSFEKFPASLPFIFSSHFCPMDKTGGQLGAISSQLIVEVLRKSERERERRKERGIDLVVFSQGLLAVSLVRRDE